MKRIQSKLEKDYLICLLNIESKKQQNNFVNSCEISETSTVHRNKTSTSALTCKLIKDRSQKWVIHNWFYGSIIKKTKKAAKKYKKVA